MSTEVEIHPLNAKGKYYIDQNTCLCSDSCAYYAPEHFGYTSEIGGGYYVIKQPETLEQQERCRKAMNSCPVEAIFDDGDSKYKL